LTCSSRFEMCCLAIRWGPGTRTASTGCQYVTHILLSYQLRNCRTQSFEMVIKTAGKWPARRIVAVNTSVRQHTSLPGNATRPIGVAEHLTRCLYASATGADSPQAQRRDDGHQSSRLSSPARQSSGITTNR
jgi:hypothetical protein